MQEDIAGIGQHQGWLGKYATFQTKQEMSEDFRGTPLVGMKCPVTVLAVLHYIFASWKNMMASTNHGRREAEKGFGNGLRQRMRPHTIYRPARYTAAVRIKGHETYSSVAGYAGKAARGKSEGVCKGRVRQRRLQRKKWTLGIGGERHRVVFK